MPGEVEILSLCPDCHGTGVEYYQIDADHRMELPCPVCGGTGKATDALQAVLAGEDQERKAQNKTAYLNRAYLGRPGYQPELGDLQDPRNHLLAEHPCPNCGNLPTLHRRTVNLRGLWVWEFTVSCPKCSLVTAPASNSTDARNAWKLLCGLSKP